jgi:hypothetical protein
MEEVIMEVEIFRLDRTTKLKHAINDWIVENANVEIIDIKYSSYWHEGNRKPFYSAMIIYKK